MASAVVKVRAVAFKIMAEFLLVAHLGPAQPRGIQSQSASTLRLSLMICANLDQPPLLEVSNDPWRSPAPNGLSPPQKRSARKNSVLT